MRQLNAHKQTAAITFVIFIVAVFFFAFAPGLVIAAETDTFGVGAVEENIALGGDDIRVIIARIIRVVLGLLGIIALGVVLYAGFMIMTAGGNEEKVEIGKKTLVNAVIGLIIIMSAFAIVQFVLNKLSDATGRNVSPPKSGRAPDEENFIGSGSLGIVVKDHYPFVNQKEVKRNTGISVTFADAIAPSTIIANTNRTCWPLNGETPVSMDTPDQCKKNDRGQISEYYGDCVAAPAGQKFDPKTHCDNLLTDNVRISPTASTSLRVAAAARTTYTAQGESFIFMFKPFTGLGNDLEPVSYTVQLTNDIKMTSGERVFARRGGRPYIWRFETGLEFDFDPPRVSYTSPEKEKSIARNEIVQITFTEPMDPTSIQGKIGSDGAFTGIIFNRAAVAGEWKISNENTTVEFIPAESCGVNSCGDQMFCLPVVCDPGETGTCVDAYETLVRTAQLDGTGTFQSIPFTGAADMAGNALDGGNSGDKITADGQPLHNGDKKLIQLEDKNFDNHFWRYTVRDEIDTSAPTILRVSPTVDKEGVPKKEPVRIYFSQEMLGYSLSGIGLNEYREGANIESPWFRATFNREDGKTTAEIRHREFGPDEIDYYYFVSVPSTVKARNQNCLYPGRGPIGSAACTEQEPENCVPVTTEGTRDTGCAANLSNRGRLAQPDVAACLEIMRSESKNLSK